MRAKYTIKESSFLFLGAITAIGVMVGILYLYSGYLHQQFEYVERQNQTRSVLLQSQQIQTDMAQIEGRMIAVAEMIEASGLDPEDNWLQGYLTQSGHANQLVFQFNYVSLDWLRKNLHTPEAPIGVQETYEALSSGERVYSDIIFSKRFDGYFFALAEPVYSRGKVIGALRCTIPAEELVQKKTLATVSLPEKQYIVDSKGKVLYSYGKENLTGKNLAEYMGQEFSLSEEETAELKKEILQEQAVSWPMKDYLVTSVSLSHKDWSLVQFSSYGSMHDVSHKILLSTFVLCFIMAAVLILILASMLRIINRKNRHLALQQQRIASLATAFDVLLFEYIPEQQLIVLTPGENCDYALNTLRIEKCKEYQYEIIHPDDREKILQYMDKLGADTFEMRLKGKDGSWIWSECQIQPAMKGFMGVKGVTYAGKISNIHERKMRELKLMEENTKDVLTGLMNRGELRRGIAAQMEEKKSGFLFMIDLDDFKNINDTMGHVAGDHTLQIFAGVLRKVFRSTDLVGRIGGDEFVACLLNTDRDELAMQKAEQILEQLNRVSGEENIPISVSIGIVKYPAKDMDYENLLHRADMAMYEAKAEGKNRYCIYNGNASV